MLVEITRHADRACCYTVHLDEEGQVSERPTESRIREATVVEGVEALVVVCPKDVTM